MPPRRTQSGSILIVLLLAAPLLTAIVLYVVRMERAVVRRADLQDLADVAALEAAAANARTLNAIAVANLALLTVEGLAAGTFTGGHEAALGFDALVVTLPEGIELHLQTERTVEQWREVATQIAAWQDALAAAGPALGAAATQLPVAADPTRGLVIPWPLAGTFPLARHGLPLDSGARALQAAAEQWVNARLTPRGGTSAASAVPGALCADPRAWDGAAGKRILKALGKGGRTAARGAGAALCAARELLRTANLALAKTTAGDGAPGDLAGFPMPLQLDAGYAGRLQLATAAVWLEAARRPWVALAQARARSLSQRTGGALLVPDFAPRLVPVTAGGELMAAAQAGGEAPWALQH
jgi:hypothetical protein